jgi:YidC/Oxa1 family membrane protein insertase
MFLFIKEMRSFIDFFRRGNRQARRLTFYAEHGAYGKFFEDLVEAVLKSSDMSICYITSDPKDPFFLKRSERLKVYYVDKLAPLLIVMLDAKALVLTVPDLQQFHIRRSTRGAHHFYLFHGMMSTHVVYRKGAFDHYDSIFCVGPYQEVEIRKTEALSRLKPKNLLKGGYPLLDRVHADHQTYLQQSDYSSDHKKSVLIAPSWAPGNIMESCLEEIVPPLAEQHYQVTIRPHPEFLKRSPKKMTDLRNKFKRFVSVTFELTSDTHRSLHTNDVLVTDWSGIALEYAFGTERPVLYIDTPRKVNNPDHEQLGLESFEMKLRSLTGRVLPIDEADQVHKAVADLIQNQSRYRENIVGYRQRYIYHFGTAAQKIADELIHFCKGSY